MLPLSISSSGAVLFLSPSFLDLNIENTDAASVELMTEPISMLSIQDQPNAKWQNSPVSPAVRTTPRDARRTASLAIGRADSQRVPNPP